MIKFISIYLLIINIFSFLIMFIDKTRAKHKEWRISEKSLISYAIAGGSIGMLLGMSYFRHKTNHKKFTIGVPTILIIQIILSIYLINSYFHFSS